MKPKNILRWVALLGVGMLAACGGVSAIGSGDDPVMGKAGSVNMGTANSSTGGAMGEGATGKGAEANAPSMGASSMGAAASTGGKDPGSAGKGAEASSGMCMSDTDCPNLGAPCEPCADGSYACNKTYCEAGKCINTRDVCAPKCASDKECPIPKIACTHCADGTQSCPAAQCIMGECQTSFPACKDIDQCKGQACGASCKQCPNGMCEEFVASFCNAEGVCATGLPQCSDPSGTCKTAMDCGSAPPDCVPCGNDICAAFDCLANKCVFTCPPNPDPECKTTEDCPAIGGVCKMCDNKKCATQACVKGSCELVCPL
jgi:hypothetical protein